MRLFDRFDFRNPRHIKEWRDADAVGDDLALDHVIGRAIGHREAEVGRGDVVQVTRSGKKFPSLFEADREFLCLLENVNFHGALRCHSSVVMQATDFTHNEMRTGAATQRIPMSARTLQNPQMKVPMMATIRSLAQISTCGRVIAATVNAENLGDASLIQRRFGQSGKMKILSRSRVSLLRACIVR